MGYIASQGEINREVLKRALFYGGVMGSFAVERFGTERLQNLTREEIDARFQVFPRIDAPGIIAEVRGQIAEVRPRVADFTSAI